MVVEVSVKIVGMGSEMVKDCANTLDTESGNIIIKYIHSVAIVFLDIFKGWL